MPAKRALSVRMRVRPAVSTSLGEGGREGGREDGFFMDGGREGEGGRGRG